MEPLIFFVKGIVAGFAVAAPVGPVAVLCIRRTIVHGLMSGVATGMGATFADVFYGVVAAFGISFVADLLSENQMGFRLVGGTILVIMAVRMARAGHPEPAVRDTDRDTGSGVSSRVGDFFSALIITGTNPITLIAFGVVFTAIGVATASENVEGAVALIAGVMVGAAAWWFSLAGLTALFSRFVGTFPVLWVNRISAIIVLACGIIALIGAVAPQSPIGRMIDLPGIGQSVPSSTIRVR
jgi:threonine/homoserine/homoserine lactone efflux protein